MKTIELNDGQKLTIKSCGAAEGYLWIELPSMTIGEAVTIFSDVNKTSKITAYGTIVHEGYIYLTQVGADVWNEGHVKVALRKEE